MKIPTVNADNPEIQICGVEKTSENSFMGRRVGVWRATFKTRSNNSTDYIRIDEGTSFGNSSVNGISFNYTVNWSESPSMDNAPKINNEGTAGSAIDSFKIYASLFAFICVGIYFGISYIYGVYQKHHLTNVLATTVADELPRDSVTGYPILDIRKLDTGKLKTNTLSFFKATKDNLYLRTGGVQGALYSYAIVENNNGNKVPNTRKYVYEQHSFRAYIAKECIQKVTDQERRNVEILKEWAAKKNNTNGFVFLDGAIPDIPKIEPSINLCHHYIATGGVNSSSIDLASTDVSNHIGFICDYKECNINSSFSHTDVEEDVLKYLWSESGLLGILTEQHMAYLKQLSNGDGSVGNVESILPTGVLIGESNLPTTAPVTDTQLPNTISADPLVGSTSALAKNQEKTSLNSLTVPPSFDCAKVSTISERLICSNNDLAAADVKLMQVYKEAALRSVDKDALKKTQNAWRKMKRDTCSDAKCIQDVYESRIIELNATH